MFIYIILVLLFWRCPFTWLFIDTDLHICRFHSGPQVYVCTLSCSRYVNLYIFVSCFEQQLIKSFEVCDLPVRSARFVARKNWVVTGSVSDIFLLIKGEMSKVEQTISPSSLV